jgi:hypothetical protein
MLYTMCCEQSNSYSILCAVVCCVQNAGGCRLTQCCVQRAACSVQRAACSVQRAACSVQRAM